MKKLSVLIVIVLIIMTGWPVIAEAQLRGDDASFQKALAMRRVAGRRGTIYGSGRGVYSGAYVDPIEMAMLQDFLKMPGNLSACRGSMSAANPNKEVATDCHILIRSTPESLQAQLANFPESSMLGTQHSENGTMHFRAYDSTHKPFNKNHKDCIPVESQSQQESQVPAQQGGGPVEVSAKVSASRPQSAAVLVDPLAELTWPTENTHQSLKAVVIDPNNGKTWLLQPGASVDLPDPSGERPYTAAFLEPGRGKSNQISAEIRPNRDLSGWEIVARE